jgi:transposase InsO family protein
MHTSLIVDASARTQTHGRIAEDALGYSDHGTQYTAQEFTDYCAAARITQPMSSPGVT